MAIFCKEIPSANHHFGYLVIKIGACKQGNSTSQQGNSLNCLLAYIHSGGGWIHVVHKATRIINTEFIYLDPPRGAKWMVKGAIKQPLRVQTPPLGGCWYTFTIIGSLRHRLGYNRGWRVVESFLVKKFAERKSRSLVFVPLHTVAIRPTCSMYGIFTLHSAWIYGKWQKTSK